MTDAQAQIIHERVEQALNDESAPRLDIGNPKHLEFLVNHVRSALSPSLLAEDELRLVVAMCWLGPSSPQPPPTQLRTTLLELLHQQVEDAQTRVERVMEFAIAYGCGKWRDVQAGYGGWEQRWQGAMRGLVRALEPAVAQSNRWLSAHVVGFPAQRGTSPATTFEDSPTWSDAWTLAIRLLRPEHILQVPPEDTLRLECLGEGDETGLGNSSGTSVTIPAEEYEQLAPPGAKVVGTLQDRTTYLHLPDKQTFVLAPDTHLFVIARDDDALIKTTPSTSGAERPQQVRLKPGEPAEAEGPFTVAIWECTCGTTHCQERHRLQAWDPVHSVSKTLRSGKDAGQKKKTVVPLTLWDFVASAVKGPQASIKTGSFVQGLYFPLLAQEGCDP